MFFWFDWFDAIARTPELRWASAAAGGTGVLHLPPSAR